MQGAVIWIEGIIGAGKSTITQKLAGLLECRALHEPVEHDYLDKFYKDQKKYAFEFQLRQLARRQDIHELADAEAKCACQYKGAILDRGLPGDRVFAKLHCHYGNITAEQWTTYELLFNNAMSKIKTPALLAFFDVDPDVAMERVRNRNRGAESGLTIDYLRTLRKGYLDLLVEIEGREHRWCEKIQILRVPWNQDHQEASIVAQQIKDRLRM